MEDKQLEKSDDCASWLSHYIKFVHIQCHTVSYIIDRN